MATVTPKPQRSSWTDDELEMLRDTARTFFEREAVPHRERWAEQQHVDREYWNKAGEVGLLCAGIPEAYGGGGGTFAHEAILIEEQTFARDSAWGASVHSGIVAPYVLHYGSEEQKQAWLPKLASGELVGAIAMTEPGTGSDLQGIATTAVRDGDEYVINGAKTFITNGLLGDLIIVACKTNVEVGSGAAGISLVVLETEGLEGFSRGRVLKKIGMHGQDTAELFFSDVRVPAANLLGDAEGQGFIQLMQQLPQERLIIGVTAVAVMEQVVEQTLQYTKERTAFGKPILSFQNTRFKLAERKTEAVIARVFLDDCIERHLRGELDAQRASMAKYWLTEKQCETVDECLQLFGGYGFMEEYPISQAWVDSRVQKIYGGTNEIMKEIIGRTL